MQRATKYRSNNKDALYSTSFAASAELKCDFGLLEKTLEELPALRKISYGSALTYKVLEHAHVQEDDAEISFGRHSVEYKTFFRMNESSNYRKNLLKFMSIIVYVKDLYSVDFSSIYGYIIEALRVEDIVQGLEGGLKSTEERITALNETNVKLAHALIDKENESALLNMKISEYDSFFKEFSRSIEISSGYTLESLMKKIGMYEKLAEIYKPIRQDWKNKDYGQIQ